MVAVFENMSIHTPGMDDCIIEFIAEKGEQILAKYRHPIHIITHTNQRMRHAALKFWTSLGKKRH